MNGLGVGSAVGLGVVIGSFLINGGYLPPLAVIMFFLFYGGLAGLIFWAYKWALHDVHVQFPPWRR